MVNLHAKRSSIMYKTPLATDRMMAGYEQDCGYKKITLNTAFEGQDDPKLTK